ncbi:MAG: hypothetical protein L0Y36_04315 [Planctomycetales bacterium]|nr:hypothetical protein [Planctomycetales bacterium]
MAMSNWLFVSAIMSVLWGVVSFAGIVSFLSRRGIKINYLLIRILIFKYVHQYYRITREETGRPGPWFYSYMISMNLALVLVIAGIVIKAI